eukprot:m.341661 g.341661  ORF g.341661 m.341661 type:complete len:816 (-) comp20333_c0_seq1:152-2599(-)
MATATPKAAKNGFDILLSAIHAQTIAERSNEATESQGSVKDKKDEEENSYKNDSPYFSKRPLAAVHVPKLDKQSVKQLPPALRQLADFNPKGEVEQSDPLPSRRKRKTLQLGPDFVKEPVFRRSNNRIKGTLTAETKPKKHKRKKPHAFVSSETLQNGGDSEPSPAQQVVAIEKEAKSKRRRTTRKKTSLAGADGTSSSSPVGQIEKSANDDSGGGEGEGHGEKFSIPRLDKTADVSKLPRDLKRLQDFNWKGVSEISEPTNLPPRRRSQKPSRLNSYNLTKPGHSKRKQKQEPGSGSSLSSKSKRRDQKWVSSKAAFMKARKMEAENSQQKEKHTTSAQQSAQHSQRKGKEPVGSLVQKSQSATKRARKPDSNTREAGAAIQTQLSAKAQRIVKSLMDHNPKGLGELEPLPSTRSTKPRPSAEADDVPSKFSIDDYRRWMSKGRLKNEPQAKVWIMMDNKTHRCYRKAMGSLYEYKQHIPTPEFLRKHGFPFSVHIHEPGEFIVSAGHSHYVVSGNSRGFSWSHVDPGTIKRLRESDESYGSRQADGKPNTFSEYFHRSPDLMEALQSNLDEPEACWGQSQKEMDAHVIATLTDDAYYQKRLREGWQAGEIKPLYLPTVEQLNNPNWFTAMMTVEGSKHGALHIKFPKGWFSAEHNYGHVSWSSSANLWKQSMTEHVYPKEEKKIIRAKIVRPDSQGCASSETLISKQQNISVPTKATEFSAFIECLPQISRRCPLLYGPQVKINEEQKEQLGKLMPSWAMPLSSIDGLRNVLKNPAEGTTTPTGFGGRMGVTGLHDEYNHTVSYFVYPMWGRK